MAARAHGRDQAGFPEDRPAARQDRRRAASSRGLLVAATAVATAAACFAITATTGFAAGTTKEPVYTFASPFSAVRAPDLNLRCEYDSGAYFNDQPFLLCGHFVNTRAGGVSILTPLGLTVRIRAGTVTIERYREQAGALTIARFTR